DLGFELRLPAGELVAFRGDRDAVRLDARELGGHLVETGPLGEMRASVAELVGLGVEVLDGEEVVERVHGHRLVGGAPVSPGPFPPAPGAPVVGGVAGRVVEPPVFGTGAVVDETHA